MTLNIANHVHNWSQVYVNGEWHKYCYLCAYCATCGMHTS